mgnify:CR=1 FL=1
MTKWSTVIHLQNANTAIQTGSIQIRRGIFQGNTLSPLWFCLAVNPLYTLLKETSLGFNIRNNRRAMYNVPHLLYMDDIKLYAPNKGKLLQLIQIVRDFLDDIRMKFGLDKCRKLEMDNKSPRRIEAQQADEEEGKIEDMEPNEMFRYLGIQQNKRIEHKIMKELREKFVSHVKQILKTGLNSKNITKAINTSAVPVLTYSYGIIDWNDIELQDVERKVRVLMENNSMLHPRSAIERLTLPRSRGGRGVQNLK